MSISGSLFNAYSGLVAASRTAEVVSQNVANATTEGFGRRDISLAAASLNGRGAGVRVIGVSRNVDQIAIADRRLANATEGERQSLSKAFSQMEAAIGVPGQGGSLSDLVTGFESALVSAQSRPDSQVRLKNVVYAANDLIGKVRTISARSQDQRMAADKSIGKQVKVLNDSLAGVAKLNRDIRLQIGTGRDVNGLMDQRQVLVDKIAGIVPLKIYQRPHGQITITSGGGAVLLEGKPSVFGFRETGIITPDMTKTSGALSGLTLNGKPIALGGSYGLLNGGSLSAQFQIRDETAPFASKQIDAFARNLIERFQSAGVDPTLATGAAGLFTDGGAALNTALETGLAGRLSLNAAVDPATGGAEWRIRDGLGATTPGAVGNATLISSLVDTLSARQAVASGQFSSGATSLSGLSGDLTALNSAARLHAEQSAVFAQSRLQELTLIEKQGGVDTDSEMQKLLLVEQAYAANARVISTVDKMLKTILEM